MGFSILIPVYNTHVKDLVKTLLRQSKSLQIPFEIILLDDCSELSISYLNLKLNSLEHISYNVLSENIGRSKIRNKLFEMAQYNFCLIMDGDVGIVKESFLKNYWVSLQKNEIVVGGHEYPTLPPLEKEKYLHWLYGSKIEVKSLNERLKYPYKSFKTVCFGITKNIFNKIKFDENLTQYGHEDTLFGLTLESEKIPIIHIDNPVLHLGIDPLNDFLVKQQVATFNLKKLYQKDNLKSVLKQKAKLIKFAENKLFFKICKLFSKVIEKNLYSDRPNIWALQLQKIIWWNQMNVKE